MFHMNDGFGSMFSDDVWVRYTIPDNKDPMLGYVVQ